MKRLKSFYINNIYYWFFNIYTFFNNKLFSKLPYPYDVKIKLFFKKIRNFLFPNRHNPIESNIDFEFNPKNSKEGWSIPPLPKWAIEEMKELGEIDPAVYPYKDTLNSIEFYSMPNIPQAGSIYGKIREMIPDKNYTHIIFAPWIKRGGLDKGILLTAYTLKKRYNKNVLIILTENSKIENDSPIAKELKDDIIEFGKEAIELSENEKQIVLLRVILQLSPKVCHIINSDLAWSLLKEYPKALKSSAKIFATLVCDDYTPEGMPIGYARKYLPFCYQDLQSVLSDNKTFPLSMQKAYGFDSSLFYTAYYPVEKIAKNITYKGKEGSKDILWAGRLDRQKRPDILIKVAKKLPEFTFHVYGESIIFDDEISQKELKNIQNIILYGKYEGFNSITDRGYLCYFYTSEWDGLPNVLLEATMYGLVCIASDVGGVGEFINEKTGYLIKPFDDPQRYIKAIKEIGENFSEAKAKWENALKLVRERHSMDRYSKALSLVKGYTDDKNR